MTTSVQKNNTLCVVIPCYNEADFFLHKEYNNFLENHKDIVICFVNDGSTDNTHGCLIALKEKFEDQIIVLNLEKNSGKASAVKYGMNYCNKNVDYENIAYLDADLAVSLEECYQLKNHINENIDFVFGSRVLRIGANIVRKSTRHIIGRIIATLISNVLSLKVYDSQCGCKIFKKKLASNIFEKQFISKWLFDVEIFFRILILYDYNKEKAISTMMEVPLKRWIDRGDSKVKLTYFFKIWTDLIKIKRTYRHQKTRQHKKINKNSIKLNALIIIVASICYHVVYNIKTIIPTNINWLLSAYHDWGQHYLGWTFYRKSPWTFPLGDMYTYFHPVGTNVGFTDSIPLLALLFKPFSGILPDDFQYFGFFIFSAFVLNALFSYKIFQLYRLNWFYSICAVIFIITTPLFIFRGMHPALTAHWLIIASIYLYLKPQNNNSKHNNYKQLLLFFLSCAIHPYLAAMVYGFCIILPIKDYFLNKSINRKQLFIFPFLSLLSGLFFWFILGMIGFNNGNSVNAMGLYGESSFNLNSFFNSYYYYSKIVNGLPWVSSGQHEGFSYLGFGMLIVSLFSIIVLFIKRRYFQNLYNAKYSILIIFTLTLLLFAVSHIVTFGDKILFEVPIPKFLKTFGGIFRGSGRFCWPFYYMFVLFTLVIFATSIKNKVVKNSLIISLLILQLYDIQTILTNRDLKLGTFTTKLDDNKWKNLFSNFDEIITYPPFEKTLLYNFDYQDLMFIASKVDKPISTGYVARAKPTQKFVDSINIAINNEGEINFKSSLFVTTGKYLEAFKSPILNKKVSINKLNDFFLIYDKNKDLKNIDLTLNQIQDSISKSLNKLIKEKSSNYTSEVNESLLDKNEVRFGIDEFSKSKNSIKIRGWAFDYTTNNNSKDSVFVTFSNNSSTYMFNVKLLSRPDVTSYFERENLDMCGFDSILFLNDLPNDYYQIGFAIKNETICAFKKTEYFINKTN